MTKIFFAWKDEYSVNVQEIDEQHKKIINMLNELYTAFMLKEHRIKIGSIVAELGEYANYHFTTEEKYFKEFGYSEQRAHIIEHELFNEKVKLFCEEYKVNKSALTFTVINFLKDWLNKHILVEDKKYMECFEKNGLK